MYVCVCKGVREGDIRSLTRAESGLRMRDLRERLGVCSECGKCGSRALGVLRDRHPEAEPLELEMQA
jgi:bacterioferritin-associated ferredoxin